MNTGAHNINIQWIMEVINAFFLRMQKYISLYIYNIQCDITSELLGSNPPVDIYRAEVGCCAKGRARLKGEGCNAKGLNRGRSSAVIRVKGGFLGWL